MRSPRPNSRRIDRFAPRVTHVLFLLEDGADQFVRDQLIEKYGATRMRQVKKEWVMNDVLPPRRDLAP